MKLSNFFIIYFLFFSIFFNSFSKNLEFKNQIEIKNIKFLSETGGDIYIFLDGKELNLDKTAAIKINIFDTKTNRLIDTINFYPGNRSRMLIKLEDLDESLYSIEVDKNSLPEFKNGTLNIQYFPENSLFNVKNRTIKFGKIVFSISNGEVESSFGLIGNGINGIHYNSSGDTEGYSNLKDVSDIAEYVSLDSISDSYNFIVYDSIVANSELDGLVITKNKKENKAKIIKNIANLKKNGKKVIVSLGGDDSNFSFLNNHFIDTKANNFVQNLKEIIQEYDFDGIELNISSEDIINTDPLVIASLFKKVTSFYKNINPNFIVALSLDWINLNSSKKITGKWYEKFINSFDDQNIDFYFVKSYQNDKNINLSQSFHYKNDSYSVNLNGIESFIKKFILMITDFSTNSEIDNFIKIEKEKLVLVLPTSQNSVKYKEYYLSEENIQNIHKFLRENKIQIAGIIGNDLNFDSLNKYNFGENVGNLFGTYKKQLGNLKINLDFQSDLSPYSLSDYYDEFEVEIISSNGDVFKKNINKDNPSIIINNLLVNNSYYLKVNGVIDSLNKVFFEKIETDWISLIENETVTSTLTHNLLSKNSDRFKAVKFSISGLTSEELNDQKVYFLDLNEEYLYPVNNFKNGENYFFLKKSNIDISLKTTNIVKFFNIDSNKILGPTKEIIISFVKNNLNIPEDKNKINGTYYASWGGVKINEIPDCYNVIFYSFADASDKDNKVKLNDPSKISNNIINELNLKGQKAIVSIKDFYSIKNNQDGEVFEKSLNDLLNNYSFNGIDFNFKNDSIVNSNPLICAQVIKRVMVEQKKRDPEFLLFVTFEYPYLNRSYLHPVSNTFYFEHSNLNRSFIHSTSSSFYIDFVSEMGFENIDYFNIQLYKQFGNELSLYGYDNKSHFIGNEYNCEIKDGIAEFVQHAVWALTTDEGAILNNNYELLPIPKNKFIIVVPSGPSAVDKCPLMQVLDPLKVDDVYKNILKNGTYVKGFSNWQAATDNNFELGEAIAKTLGISKKTGEIETGYVTIQLEPLSLETYGDIFGSINSIYGEILKSSDDSFITSFNIDFAIEGNSINTIVKDIPLNTPFYYKIYGLANPEKNIYLSPIEQEDKTTFLNSTDQEITLSAEYLISTPADDLRDVSISITGIDNDLIAKQKLQYTKNETSQYIYAKDNNLKNGTYTFLKNDYFEFNPILKDCMINLIDPSYFWNNESSSFEFSMRSLVPEVDIDNKFKNINATYYEDIQGLEIDNIPDIYNVIILGFFIREEGGNYKIHGGKWISTGIAPDYGFIDLQQDPPVYLKTKIDKLKSQGRKVLLSIGGENTSFKIKNQDDADGLEAALISTIDKFGFDGIDLDLEDPTLNISDSDGALFGSAIYNVVQHYKDLGVDFWLTNAMEYPYLDSRLLNQPFYINLINEIGVENFNYFWMQSYNQSLNYIKGYDDEYVCVTNLTNFNGENACGTGILNSMYDKPNRVGVLNFLQHYVWAFTTQAGANANPTYSFLPLPSKKFVLGVLSGKKGARGCPDLQVLKPEEIKILLKNLKDMDLKIAGFMSWSSNKDISENANSTDFPFGQAVNNELKIKPKGNYSEIDGSVSNVSRNFKSLDSLISNIKINGKLISDDLSKEINFIVENKIYNISNVDPNIQYTLSLNGIGNPETGEYYPPYTNDSFYLNSNEILNQEITYDEILDDSDLKSYSIKIINEELLMDHGVTIEFIDNDKNYNFQKLLLKEGIYKIPSSVLDFDFTIKAPKFLAITVSKGNNSAEITCKYQSKPEAEKINVIYWDLSKNENFDFVKLSKIPKFYNTIVVNDVIKYDQLNNEFVSNIKLNLNRIDYGSKDFKDDILYMQRNGYKILFSINSETFPYSFDFDFDKFYNIIKNLILEYNFDGIDLNLNSDFLNTMDPFDFGDVFYKVKNEMLNYNRNILISLTPFVSDLTFDVIENNFYYRFYKICFIQSTNDLFDDFYFIAPKIYGENLIDITENNIVYKFNDSLENYVNILIQKLTVKEKNKFSKFLLFNQNKFILNLPITSLFNEYSVQYDINNILNNLDELEIDISGVAGYKADYDYTEFISKNTPYTHKRWDFGRKVVNAQSQIFKTRNIEINILDNEDYSIKRIELKNNEDLYFYGIIYNAIDNSYVTDFKVSLNNKFVFEDAIIGNKYKILIKGIVYSLDGILLNPIRYTFDLDETTENLFFKIEKNNDKYFLNIRITPSKIPQNLLFSQKISFFERDINSNNDYLYVDCPLKAADYKFIDEGSYFDLGYAVSQIKDYYITYESTNDGDSWIKDSRRFGRDSNLNIIYDRIGN